MMECDRKANSLQEESQTSVPRTQKLGLQGEEQIKKQNGAAAREWCSSTMGLIDIDVLTFGLTVDELGALRPRLQLNPSKPWIEVYYRKCPETHAFRGRLMREFLQSTQGLKSLFLWGGQWRHVCMDGEKNQRTYLPQILSGLKANSAAPVATLSVLGSEDRDIIHVAQIIQCLPQLQELKFHMQESLVSEAAIEALVSALRWASTRNLRKLRFYSGNLQVMAEVLARSFRGASSSGSLNTIIALDWDDGTRWGFEDYEIELNDALPILMETKIPNIKLELNVNLVLAPDTLCGDEWNRMGSYVRNSPRLESLTVIVKGSGLWKLIEGLTEFWEGSDRSPKVKFKAVMDMDPDVSDYEDEHLEPVCSNRFLTWAMSSNILSKLRLKGPNLDDSDFRFSLGLVRSNSSIVTLKIKWAEGGSRRQWKWFFDCLKPNPSIKHLVISQCDGLNDHSFRDMMGMLRVNSTLETIDLSESSWATDYGKLNLLEEALERNRHRRIVLSRHEQLVFSRESTYGGNKRLELTMRKVLSRKRKLHSNGSERSAKARSCRDVGTQTTE